MSLAEYLPLALAADRAYKDHLSAFGPYTEVLPVFKGHVESYVILNCQTIGIVFRGTDDIWDWFQNIRIVSPAYGCHPGFLDMYRSVWPTIWSFVEKHYSDHNVCVTGHSLGGDLAVLACRTLLTEGVPIRRAATFGAPPLFTTQAAQFPEMHKLVKRFVNGNDIVPHLLWWRGFRHEGHLQQIGNYRWWRWLSCVKDHSMTRYVQSLAAKVVKEPL